jgi:hypothetical protein
MTTKRKVAFGVALLLLLMAVVVIGVRSVSSPVAPPDPAPPEREVAAAGETDVREAREPVAPRPTTTSERKPAAPPRPARPGPVVPPGRSGPPPVVVETVGVWGGSYRGPGGMVPPMARAPCDPQPPPPSRIPLPGAGDLSPVEGRRTMSFESWVFWWAHASDEILHRHVARRPSASLDTEVRERIAPALARFARGREGSSILPLEGARGPRPAAARERPSSERRRPGPPQGGRRRSSAGPRSWRSASTAAGRGGARPRGDSPRSGPGPRGHRPSGGRSRR